jgi:diguanylate cyclase (GGDEF)-like protein
MQDEAKAFRGMPGRPAILLLAVVAFALVVAADYLTSYDLSLSAFYVLIILAVGWFCGLWWGGLFACLAMLSEFEIGLLTGNPFSSDAAYYLSHGNRLFAYLLIAYLTATMRSLYNRASSAARVDYVTGVTNSTGFYEKLAVELARHRRNREPFAVAYVSCDYFKIINDGLGHREGDRVLMAIAQTLETSLRQTDVVARVGGDEFGLVFPQTSEENALAVMRKLCTLLDRAMAEHEWPITFSVGVGIFPRVPASVDRTVAFCDRLMQRVKALGKNKLMHRVYDPDEIEAPMPAKVHAIR